MIANRKQLETKLQKHAVMERPADMRTFTRGKLPLFEGVRPIKNQKPSEALQSKMLQLDQTNKVRFSCSVKNTLNGRISVCYVGKTNNKNALISA